MEIGEGRVIKASYVLYQTSVVGRNVVPDKLGDSTSNHVEQ
jgi:hypothetical protein